ncbi:hypothetical protein JOF29_005158 [Kribbella aluminosa]|uniref:Uncharacterized protein n=1 Tax=Kribbella aluminosa TaxID=416017 RepID=A0ABS4UQY7_9ACTN|nr:hypothetical protein [Kribbella aluminosa]
MVGPRLVAEWVDVHGLVHGQVLLARDLQYEHVMYVVVRGEALRLRGMFVQRVEAEQGVVRRGEVGPWERSAR